MTGRDQGDFQHAAVLAHLLRTIPAMPGTYVFGIGGVKMLVHPLWAEAPALGDGKAEEA